MQVVMQATPVLPQPLPQAQAKFEEDNEEVYLHFRWRNVVPSGLYGNPVSGKAWSEGEDGRYAGVTKITVTTDEKNTVNSIQLQYIEWTGRVVDRARHGGPGCPTVFKLKFPLEHLMKVTGYYGPDPFCGSVTRIRSLTFITNIGKYGPVGKEEGTYFETNPLFPPLPPKSVDTEQAGTTEAGVTWPWPCATPIVGFFGRADKAFLYAIGVYYASPLFPPLPR